MKKFFIALCILSLVACASRGPQYSPIVDSPSTSYSTDLAQCQQYANSVQGAADRAVVGAVVGGVFSLLLMAAAGGDAREQRLAGTVGALGGGVSAAGAAMTDQRTIITRCLLGRGHKVLL